MRIDLVTLIDTYLALHLLRKKVILPVKTFVIGNKPAFSTA